MRRETFFFEKHPKPSATSLRRRRAASQGGHDPCAFHGAPSRKRASSPSRLSQSGASGSTSPVAARKSISSRYRRGASEHGVFIFVFEAPHGAPAGAARSFQSSLYLAASMRARSASTTPSGSAMTASATPFGSRANVSSGTCRIMARQSIAQRNGRYRAMSSLTTTGTHPAATASKIRRLVGLSPRGTQQNVEESIPSAYPRTRPPLFEDRFPFSSFSSSFPTLAPDDDRKISWPFSPTSAWREALTRLRRPAQAPLHPALARALEERAPPADVLRGVVHLPRSAGAPPRTALWSRRHRRPRLRARSESAVVEIRHRRPRRPRRKRPLSRLCSSADPPRRLLCRTSTPRAA